MPRPEDFGANSGAGEQDQVSQGAHAQFHDLVYRYPTGGGAQKDEPFICHGFDLNRTHGGFGAGRRGDAEEALGQLYVELAREGKLDRGTLKALDKIGDELNGDAHYMGHGGHGYAHRGGRAGEQVQLVSDTTDGGATDGSVIGATDSSVGATDGSVGATDSSVGATDGSVVGATDGSVIGASAGQGYDAAMQAQMGLGAGDQTGATQVGADGMPITQAGPVGADATTAGALAPADVQQLTQIWAATHGANPTDAAAFQQVAQGADGKTSAVGPYALDANIIGSWFQQAAGQNGAVDANALQQFAAAKGLSQETAAAIATPEFQQFMSGWSQGQPPSAEQVAKFLPQDLQNAIAGDMVTSMASALGQSGQQLDPGVLLASLEMRKPLTQADLQDANIAGYVQQIDQSLVQAQSGAVMGADGSATGVTTGGTGMDGSTTGFSTSGTGMDSSSGVSVTGGDGAVTGGTGTGSPFTITTGDGSSMLPSTDTSGGATMGGDTGPITIAQDPNAEAAPQPAG